MSTRPSSTYAYKIVARHCALSDESMQYLNTWCLYLPLAVRPDPAAACFGCCRWRQFKHHALHNRLRAGSRPLLGAPSRRFASTTSWCAAASLKALLQLRGNHPRQSAAPLSIALCTRLLATLLRLKACALNHATRGGGYCAAPPDRFCR